MGEIIWLEVPFAENAAAKALGARWDKGRRSWYAPPGPGQGKLRKWMPRAADIDVMAPRFFLLRSLASCWSCGAIAPVFALAVPRGHGEIGEGPDGKRIWDRKEYPSILSYLQNPSREALEALRAEAPEYRMDSSAATKSKYFMNHCPGCGSKLGDHFLHDEPGAPFNPMEGEQPIPIASKVFSSALRAKAICSVVLDYPDLK